MAELTKLQNRLIEGNIEEVKQLVGELLKKGSTAKQILDEGLVAGMEVIGKRFKANEIYIPEVMIAATAMQAGMDMLKPELEKKGVRPCGKVVIGTVKGDLHDIGKNIVSMMLKGAGFDVLDLGIDVPADKFIAELEKSKAQILAMSVLLTTALNSMKETIEIFKKAKFKNRILTMVGGAPVTQAFAKNIGADGYGEDAARAVDIARELLAKL